MTAWPTGSGETCETTLLPTTMTRAGITFFVATCLVGVGDSLLMIGSNCFIGHDLRTPEASLFAFLTKPSASGPNLARRKRVDDRRHPLNDPLCQTAGAILEVLAAAVRARCRDPEELSGLRRSRKTKQLLGNRLSLGEIADPARVRGARHHAKDSGALCACLSTRAVDLFARFLRHDTSTSLLPLLEVH